MPSPFTIILLVAGATFGGLPGVVLFSLALAWELFLTWGTA